MSKLKSWNDFLEPMEHEIKDCSIVLGVGACRVDDCKGKFDGIRTHCNIRNPESNQKVKTCDYFYIPNEKTLFLCVEFSDLLAQKNTRDDSIDKIKSLDIIRSEKKSIIKKLDSVSLISDEMADKIVNTDFILRKLYSRKYSEFICDIPNENYSKHFLIVYYLPNSDEIDRARMSDSQNDTFHNEEERLNSKLATHLFAYINNKIHWLEIRTFQEVYCN
ncbi:hypothetical protein MOVS_02510 [Moraxella ovis]|uniref:Uncharacterized protein n=1 Tax=Moraxella ovis TaxID=29433 RepID=A0A378PID1_9GAMM|nr:hypothetical protein [Moraxella ovis]ANB91043.1 hypothetical protein MOVS_02510 [Moraxella ovis]STY86541.1 Uncharacterised protein [Moraxella ovis]